MPTTANKMAVKTSLNHLFVLWSWMLHSTICSIMLKRTESIFLRPYYLTMALSANQHWFWTARNEHTVSDIAYCIYSFFKGKKGTNLDCIYTNIQYTATYEVKLTRPPVHGPLTLFTYNCCNKFSLCWILKYVN